MYGVMYYFNRSLCNIIKICQIIPHSVSHGDNCRIPECCSRKMLLS